MKKLTWIPIFGIWIAIFIPLVRSNKEDLIFMLYHVSWVLLLTILAEIL